MNNRLGIRTLLAAAAVVVAMANDATPKTQAAEAIKPQIGQAPRDASTVRSALPENLQWIPQPDGAVIWDLSKRGGGGYIDFQGEHCVVHLAFDGSTDPSKHLSHIIGFVIFKGWNNFTMGDPGMLNLKEELSFPAVTANGEPVKLEKRLQYRYDGVVETTYSTCQGLSVVCELFPAMRARAVFQRWRITNTSAAPIRLAAKAETLELPQRSDSLVTGKRYLHHSVGEPEARKSGPTFRQVIATSGLDETTLQPNASATIDRVVTVFRADQPMPVLDAAAAKAERNQLWEHLGAHFKLETPDPLLDHASRLGALRLLETPMATVGPVVQNAGGLSYYPGAWANDQVEYCGPVFPLLGHPRSLEATVNMYRTWLDHPNNFAGTHMYGSYSGYLQSPSWGSRGDAAMMLYGLSLFLLNEGDPVLARDFYRLLKRADVCVQNESDEKGLYRTNTDELEGRYPSGDANLANNALAYGGYHYAARIARALGQDADAADFEGKADKLDAVIENHFGATLGGFKTYRYFVGEPIRRGTLRENEVHTQDTLRGWICMPLSAGIFKRAKGTLAAMYSDRLWFDNGKDRVGLRVSEKDKQCNWPRQTWYGIHATFRAGAPDIAHEKMRQLLKAVFGGDGPYLSEDGGDIASPTGLFMRSLTEGLFGIDPLSFDSVRIKPSMPNAWNEMALRGVRVCGRMVDIEVKREDGKPVVRIIHNGTGIAPVQGDPTLFDLGNLPPVRLR